MTDTKNKRNGIYFLPKDTEIKMLPSVTSIVGDTTPKPQLVYWAARLAARAALQTPTMGEDEAVSAIILAKTEGAKRGSLIHSFIEAIENQGANTIDGLPEVVRGYAQAHQKFIEDVKPQLLFNEQIVVNWTFGYAGTLDRVYKIGEKTIIVDFKTTAEKEANFYKEWEIQLEAYRNAEFMYKGDGVYETFPQIDETMVVLLMADGTYSIKVTHAPFEVFCALRKVWLYLVGEKKIEKIKTKKLESKKPEEETENGL